MKHITGKTFFCLLTGLVVCAMTVQASITEDIRNYKGTPFKNWKYRGR